MLKKIFKLIGLSIPYILLVPLLSLILPDSMGCSLKDAFWFSTGTLVLESVFYIIIYLCTVHIEDITAGVVMDIDEFIIFIVSIIISILIFILVLPIEAVRFIITGKSDVYKDDKISLNFRGVTVNVILGIFLSLISVRGCDVGIDNLSINNGYMFAFLVLCFGSFIVFARKVLVGSNTEDKK